MIGSGFASSRPFKGYMGVIRWFPKTRGTLLGGPHNKDYKTLGSRLGPSSFGKLPYMGVI